MEKIECTAIIMAKNEAHQIERALQSLQFCAEILIFLDDKKSEQATIDLAGRYGASCIIKSLKTEGQRRTAACQAAKFPWILELDADEEVTPECAAEIRAVLPSAEYGYFLIPFDNYIGTRRVRHGWGSTIGTAAKACLCAKGVKSWGDENQHPRVQLLGKRQWLKNRINHYIDDDLHDLFARLNRYSTNRAQQLMEQGRCESLGVTLWRAVVRFLRLYIRRGGYKEGIYGLTVAIAAGLYPLLSVLKYHEMRDKNH